MKLKWKGSENLVVAVCAAMLGSSIVVANEGGGSQPGVALNCEGQCSGTTVNCTTPNLNCCCTGTGTPVCRCKDPVNNCVSSANDAGCK